MKTTIVTQEEFSKIMECCEAYGSISEVGHTHSVTTYSRTSTNTWGCTRVSSIGWHRTSYYQDEAQHTFTVPTFLYEAYIK